MKFKARYDYMASAALSSSTASAAARSHVCSTVGSFKIADVLVCYIAPHGVAGLHALVTGILMLMAGDDYRASAALFVAVASAGAGSQVFTFVSFVVTVDAL
eukprot:1831863-Alexandrium_andersonii.AAC.1